MQQYWENHPFQRELMYIAREGHWVTHVFEWIFMMISRFAGYLMTLAVGYLIYYAIEYKHSLDAVIKNPGVVDHLASFSNVIINVGPELVFPGVVVLCIRAFTARRWLDGVLYMVTTIAFAILTMVLLNAFMNDGITKDFLSAMLFWRAAAALFYTIVVAYCGGGLDLRSLLSELDGLRGQLDNGQQTVSSLEEQLLRGQQTVSTLQQHVDAGQREIERLSGQLDSGLHAMEELQFRLQDEQKRMLALQDELEGSQAELLALQRKHDGVLVDMQALSEQVDSKQKEIVRLNEAVESERGQVSSLRDLVTAGQREIMRLLERPVDSGRVDTGRSVPKQKSVDGGQGTDVDTGQQSRVIRLDATRRKNGQSTVDRELDERIMQVITAEPELSDRAIAARVGCSPTTVGKRRTALPGRQATDQESTECVNE